MATNKRHVWIVEYKFEGFYWTPNTQLVFTSREIATAESVLRKSLYPTTDYRAAKYEARKP